MEAAGDWSAHSLLFDKGGMVIYFKRPHDDDVSGVYSWPDGAVYELIGIGINALGIRLENGLILFGYVKDNNPRIPLNKILQLTQ